MRAEESQKQAEHKGNPLVFWRAVRTDIWVTHHVGIHVSVRVVDNDLRRGSGKCLRLLERRHLLTALRANDTSRIDRRTAMLAVFRFGLALAAARAEARSVLKHSTTIFTIHSSYLPLFELGHFWTFQDIYGQDLRVRLTNEHIFAILRVRTQVRKYESERTHMDEYKRKEIVNLVDSLDAEKTATFFRYLAALESEGSSALPLASQGEGGQ